MSVVKVIVFVFWFSSLVYCTPKSPVPVKIHHKHAKSYWLMTYNVENLFDHRDDPGKADETYLPVSQKQSRLHQKRCQKLRTPFYRKSCATMDWTERKVDEKLKRLADTILQVNKGKGPDFLFLQEVENISVVEKLRVQFLAEAGYKKTILIDGPDARGIDVAILAKHSPVGRPSLHPIVLPGEGKKRQGRKTRGILQSRFRLSTGHFLTLLGVHFPSQGSPTPFRKAALTQLLSLASKKKKTEYVVAAGDFNVTRSEDQKHRLFGDSLQNDWIVSHKSGCGSCQGTHNYRGGWSFLDVMLLSSSFRQGPWKLRKESVAVVSSGRYQKTRKGRPKRFDEGRHSRGVSDHFPLVAQIVYQPVKEGAKQ